MKDRLSFLRLGSRYIKRPFVGIGLVMALFLGLFIFLPAQSAFGVDFPIPTLQIGVGGSDQPEDIVVGLQIVALLTILTLAPAILILMTPFTRIIVVFHFLRQALGVQSSPPNQVIVGLSLFMTFFIMTPVWQDVYSTSLEPYMDKQINYQEAFVNAQVPVRKFMLKNTRESDLALFLRAARMSNPNTRDEVSLITLVPAFVISELKTAFIIGFVIYVPFIIIDMVVASVLLAMGMMMLPPAMVSLPFKLMLFVLVDGWSLMVGSMLNSFG